MNTTTHAYFQPDPTHSLSFFLVCVLCLQILRYSTWPFVTLFGDIWADADPSHALVLWTYRAPVWADLPVRAEAELAGLCGLWWGEVGTALWVDHGGAVPKALPAL